MSRRRRKQRMLPRAARRAARADVLRQAAGIQANPVLLAGAEAIADHQLVNRFCGGRDYLAGPAPRIELAEMWIACGEMPEEYEPDREALMAALAREYRRLTGRQLDDDEAEAAIDEHEQHWRAAARRDVR